MCYFDSKLSMNGCVEGFVICIMFLSEAGFYFILATHRKSVCTCLTLMYHDFMDYCRRIWLHVVCKASLATNYEFIFPPFLNLTISFVQNHNHRVTNHVTNFVSRFLFWMYDITHSIGKLSLSFCCQRLMNCISTFR